MSYAGRRAIAGVVALVLLCSGGLGVATPGVLDESELDKVLTIEETADFLRLPLADVREAAAGGEIPGRRIAGQWRFSRIALIQWLNDGRPLQLHRAAPGTAPGAPPEAAPLNPARLTAVVGRQSAPPVGVTPGPSPSAPPTVGEKPAARSAEQVALRDQGVLLRRGQTTVEAGLSYARAERQVLTSRVEQNNVTASAGLRRGLADDLQASISVPLRHTRDAVVTGEPAGALREQRTGSGDVSLALLGVGWRESAASPALLWNVQAVVPGGAGDAGLGAGFSVTRSLDPLILFGGASYLRGLRIDAEDRDRGLARHNFGFNFGYAFAVNDVLALTGQFIGTYRNHEARSGVTPPARERYQLQFGATYVISPRFSVEPTVSFGVGGSAPDLSLGISFPYSF